MSTLYGMTVTFGGGISGSTVPQVTVKAPTGSTVTAKKGDIVLTAAEKSGVWVFDLPEFGSWVITATKGTQTATSSVVFEGSKSVNLSFFSATIAVTYPAGSTCICSNGATVLTAPDTSGSCTFIVTGAGVWTVSATDGDNYATQDVEIVNDGQAATVSLAYGALPGFTYSGDYALKTAADYDLSGDYDVLALLSSGTLTFEEGFDADVFAVGGGGGGGGKYGSSSDVGGGGGGGYTTTGAFHFDTTPIVATVGAGGAIEGGTGGTTSVGNVSASGGAGGKYSSSNAYGGAGGSGGGTGRVTSGQGGAGGSDGSNGGASSNGYNYGGAGQGTTTRAFGESGAALFAGGGGGTGGGAGGAGGGGDGGKGKTGTAGGTNTGGGGGGYGGSTSQPSKAGGSGIILIRRAQ